jgi:hypothetical protein
MDSFDFIVPGVQIQGVITVLAQSFALRGKLPNEKGEEDSPRQKFIDWLESRIISQRFKADPDAVVAVADCLKNLLIEVTDRRDDHEPREIVARLLLQRYFFDLPESIQDAIQLDPEVMTRLGVMTFKSITVGPVCFERGEFVKAAADAVNGRLARITAREPEAEFTFTSTNDSSTGRLLLEVRDQQEAVVTTFCDPLVGLLLENPQDREEWLRSHLSWFDCTPDEFEKAIVDIMSTEEPQNRVEKVMSWRKDSAAVFYANIEQQLKDSRQFSHDELVPPSAEGLLRHFRLDTFYSSETDFQAIWQKAAIAFIAEEGLASSVERMGCLPVRLPHVLWEEFDRLSREEKRGLIRKLCSRLSSPVSKLHLIDLSLRYAREDTELLDLARLSLTELFDESAGELHYRLFAALLNYINDEFGYWADAARWPWPIKLAMVWAHTSRLHNLFGRLKLDPDRLAQWFERVRRRTSAEILGRELASWNDVLHPRWQNRTNFLVHAVASIVSSYDSQVIEEVGISKLLVTTAFTGDNESRSPQISLLRDPTLTSNALDSFLGGDLSAVLAPCIGHELSRTLESSSLKSMVKEAIQTLKNDSFQQAEWLKIGVVVGNLPMYEDLAAEFQQVVRQLNFSSLDMNNPSIALLALRVASDQVVHFKDEAFRLYCESGLLEIIKAHASKGNRSDTPDIDVFLDFVLELSIRPGDMRATSKAFSKLLQDMFDAWPRLATRWRPGLSMLVRELPARQLHGIWPLVLRMRARDRRA